VSALPRRLSFPLAEAQPRGPHLSIVGLAATVVKKSKDRVRAASEWRRFSVPRRIPR
jgi:predicted ATPase with chaperone activity